MVVAAAPRPPAVPADAAAQQLAAWLAAFNTADRDAIARYRDASFAPTFTSWPPPEAERDFAVETGGFSVVRAEASTPTRAVAVLAERDSDQLARAVFEVDPQPPHRVLKVELRGIPTPPELLPPAQTEAAFVAALRAELAKRVAADQFAGAVLVARRGVPIFAQAYGLADRARNIPNTLDTRFRIGSMNKMFTAVALLQLVQAGKLSLHAPLATYLPRYPHPAAAQQLTLHHLLSHTGGTGDFFGPAFDAARLSLRTHADYVAKFGARDLEFTPGARFAYSNYGFLLAGALLEAVAGTPYYAAVAARVYRPAGMRATSSPPESTPARGRVIAYTRDGASQPWTDAAATLPWRGTAAGGGDSTVRDLLAFASALAGGKLLDAAHLALATSPQSPEQPYGYGFGTETFGATRCFGHGGGAAGMNGQLWICDSGYTIAVLANLDPPAAGRIARFAALRLAAR